MTNYFSDDPLRGPAWAVRASCSGRDADFGPPT